MRKKLEKEKEKKLFKKKFLFCFPLFLLISFGEYTTPLFPPVCRSLSLTLAWTIYRIIYTRMN